MKKSTPKIVVFGTVFALFAVPVGALVLDASSQNEQVVQDFSSMYSQMIENQNLENAESKIAASSSAWTALNLNGWEQSWSGQGDTFSVSQNRTCYVFVLGSMGVESWEKKENSYSYNGTCR